MPTARRRRFRSGAVVLLAALGLCGSAIGLPVRRTVQQQSRNRQLIAAVRRNDAGVAITFLRQGADPDARYEPERSTAVWQMLRARILGKRPTSVRALTALLLATKPHEEFDDLLDASDLPANTPDNLELIGALLDHGADPNATDPHGCTALFYAIRWQKRATANLLLTHRADPDHGDRNRVTPLMIAVYMADTRSIRLLLDHGAHVDTQDDIIGQTALMLAVTLKRPACIAAVMTAHPDLTVRDHNGKSAVDYARATGYRANVRF